MNTTHADTERPQGEGIAWGLPEQESPVKPFYVLITEAWEPGRRVTAFHLEAIANQYGNQAAEDYDDNCRPCVVCGLNFFDPGQRLGICNECADHDAPGAYKDDCDA